MTEYGESRTTTTAISDALDQSREIALAATDVLKSITSVMVPLSVFLLPNADALIPKIDQVVDRNFGVVVKVVEWQHDLGAKALRLGGSVVPN
jgi:hypothetical protein